MPGAEEAGDGAGGLEAEVGPAGEAVVLGGTGVQVAEEGDESSQGEAGAGDLVVEGGLVDQLTGKAFC